MGIVRDQIVSAPRMAAGGKRAVANAGIEPGASHAELLRQPMDRPLLGDLPLRAAALSHADTFVRPTDLAHQLLGDGPLSCRAESCGGESVSALLVRLSLPAPR